jgi:DNA ligase-1
MHEVVEQWTGAGHLPLLYTQTAGGLLNTWKCWVEKDEVCTEWGQDGGAMQTARFRCVPKNEGRANATTAEEQAVKEAIAKWKKQVKKKYHWEAQRTTGLALERRKPMLALKFEDHQKKLKFPAVLQPKYNGLRCLAYTKDGKPFLQSRGGETYVVHHIMEELANFLTDAAHGFVLDGELYIHGVSLQTLNSYVSTPQEDSALLSYMVYDVASPAEPTLPYEQRKEVLDRIFHNQAKTYGNWLLVRPVPSLVCYSAEEIWKAHADFESRGFEGTIVRSLSHPYRFGYRSDGLLKVKSWQDDEFVIIGYVPGRGKFAGFPVFRCATKDGKEFDVAPNGTAAERTALFQQADSLKGKLLTVRYAYYSDEGVPQNVRGLGIREPGDL